jgi:predicted RNA-binding Zn-ribbon protein involved in translation (DUF1610 family)
MLSKKEIRFCFECEKMPCSKLERLDKRYRERYGMSMVSNLRELEQNGMKSFIEAQTAKYKCPACGDVISVHDGKCYVCSAKKRAGRDLNPRPSGDVTRKSLFSHVIIQSYGCLSLRDKIKSLYNKPSVPGPAYFETG